MTKSNTLAYVLAGGKGSRLYSLTRSRAKPALPFGGTHRVIDFVLSNLHHSGVRRIEVLTQYESSSLHDHVRYGWYPKFGVGEIRVSPTRETLSTGWSQGTADALNQNLGLLKKDKPEIVNVFGADHVYIMDISQMNDFHSQKNADLTISVIPVKRNLAARNYGVIEVDNNWQIKGFEEKPEDPKPIPGNKDYCFVSMGNYAFGTESLLEALARDAVKEFTADPEVVRDNPNHFSKHDFGFDIIPAILRGGKKVYAYNFAENSVPGQEKSERGYWRDIGNLEEFYRASMEVRDSIINLNNPSWEILTYIQASSPVKFGKKGHAQGSIVANGSFIESSAERSILSYNTRVKENAEVSDSILMGDDVIGEGAIVRNAIIDKRVKVPDKETVGVDEEKDKARGFYEYSAIPVVPEDYIFK
jgi:glucose-1-phosphate adenylyltransferase